MVKTYRVGKKRPFWRGFLLTVVTVGIYGVYWAYKAPHELYDQFDLDEEGRDEAVVWLVLGIVVPVLLFVYFWRAVTNVQYVRTRLGLGRDVTPGQFVGAQVVGASLPAILVLAVITTSSLGAPAGDGGVDEVQLPVDPDAVVLAFAVLLLAGQIVVAYAYYLFQRSINGTWDAWLARVRELRNGAAAPASRPLVVPETPF